MEYSLELLQSKTGDFINELENSKSLHFMALVLSEQVLGYSKNFKLTHSSLIEETNSGLSCARVVFSYLNSINIIVVISKPCSEYPKMINVFATKSGYDLSDFKLATNDIAEAVNKIIKCTENRNE